VVIDDGLALWFPTPHSFKARMSRMLHVHGSRAVIAALLASLARVGLRPAESGRVHAPRFRCRQARIARSKASPISSRPRPKRSDARRVASSTGARCHDGAWRARLLRMLAHAEAEIDFPDEDCLAG
jgi:tRNA modification GTPase